MRRTKAEAEETRAKLLDVAEQLFFELGVSAVTFDRIAAAAGVTRGAIYWHFANKAELLLALDELTTLPAEEMLVLSQETKPERPLDFVCEVARQCLHIIARDERRQRIYTILFRCDYHGELAELLKRDRETTQRHFGQLLEFFELAREKGQLAAHWKPETAVRTFQWSVTGLLFEWLKDREAFDFVVDGEDMLRALLQSWSA